ncbi:MAG TPA: hypothetical protein VGO76_00555, partial [Luteibacter sp.]|nr:hypothetical protein [Luteibacter sp.]
LAFAEKFEHIKYDLGFIYKVSDVKVISHNYINYTDEKWTYALGYGLDISISGDEFLFIISHWPSRLKKPHKACDRTVYGTRLRDHVIGITKSQKSTRIILAGDYNDEPFDSPLSSHLKASRDRSRSLYYDNVFYNPFWRKIGEHQGFPIAGSTKSAAGTYYYKSGRETRWFNFDSMVFSKSFLKGSGWRLLEDHAEIVSTQDLLGLVYSKAFRFDHLPIISTIAR